MDLAAPTPARKSTLKRRLVGESGAANFDPLESYASSLGIGESAPEPLLKKFKALFEASNPDWIEDGVGSQDFDVSSQTQTQTQFRSRKVPRTNVDANILGVLREEEEESTAGTTQSNEARLKKRGFEDVDEDVEVNRLENSQSSGNSMPPTKKRATESVRLEGNPGDSNASGPTVARGQSKPPSLIKTVRPQKEGKGASAGKLDTDADFLKAIASTKRGKKHEDNFDREFNKLKISKPDLNQEEPEKEWAVLADFGDDSGIRGNFMIVLDMDVFRNHNGEAKQQAHHPTLPEWQGRPNFKKFKKKVSPIARPKVDLFISEEGDYGMGAAYWKAGALQSQTQHASEENEDKTYRRPKARSKTAGSSKTPEILEVNSDDSTDGPRKIRSKPPSRVGSVAPSTTKPNPHRLKGVAKQQQPLFLDSDDDFKEAEGTQVKGLAFGISDDEDQIPKSSEGSKPAPSRRSKRQPSKSKKPAPAIAEDDSDDDAVFKGFRGKKVR